MEKISLARWTYDMGADLVKNANDPGIGENLGSMFRFPVTEEEAMRYISQCVNTPDDLMVPLAIVVNDEAVGGISLTFGSGPYSRSASLGYWIAERYRCRGIMTQAVRILTEYAFRTRGMIRVSAEVFSDNLPSRRVLEKCGFRLEGEMRKAAVRKDGIKDICIYALT